jgi:hypothetical protein
MATNDKVGRSGLFAVPTLIEAAGREAGVGDPSMLDTPGLRALAEGLEQASSQLHFIGRRRARKLLIETLVKRLRVDSHLRREPPIRDIRLAAPIFLVAPFRTGTTLLHRLLAQDPAHRTVRLWEALQAPPAEPLLRGDPAYFERDYRVDIARRYLETRERYSPLMAAIHPTHVDAPEECFGLIETSMLSHSFMFYAPVTSYLEWLDARSDEEWRAAYALYADQLRLLHWWWPAERWVLKTPFHMWAVDALSATFPDALIVQQHRSPAACVASFCSLVAEAYAPIVTKVDPRQIGRMSIRYLRQALARNAAARARLPAERFIDIDYVELKADPIGCARRVYAAAGTPLPEATEKRMRDWLESRENTRSGGADHRYALEDYGLEMSEVHAAFAPYAAYNETRGTLT